MLIIKVNEKNQRSRQERKVRGKQRETDKQRHKIIVIDAHSEIDRYRSISRE